MINKIFFDIDETLIHTFLSPPEQGHIVFTLNKPYDVRPYYTIIRPQAQDIINQARNLIGRDNVYILTAAVKEYALKINELAIWEFREDQIFSREDLNHHSYPTAYGGSAKFPNFKIANPNNVLIDNLDPRHNEEKIIFIGIQKTWGKNYLRVRDYFGVNFPDDPFENIVKDFLLDRFSNP